MKQHYKITDFPRWSGKLSRRGTNSQGQGCNVPAKCDRAARLWTTGGTGVRHHCRNLAGGRS